ncbi:MAG: hypothetical protein M3Q10_19070, partial [Chloroflexota bacterium]|nr:hypothetical protein [Chloroflexota bacterium]
TWGCVASLWPCGFPHRHGRSKQRPYRHGATENPRDLRASADNHDRRLENVPLSLAREGGRG